MTTDTPDLSPAALEALVADVLASAEHAPSALAWPNETVARLAARVIELERENAKLQESA